MKLIDQQRKLDRDTRKMAREIVEAQNPRTLAEARRFAAAWIETAAQTSRNAGYWEKRARKAERRLEH
jgi:hypothetical protein